MKNGWKQKLGKINECTLYIRPHRFLILYIDYSEVRVEEVLSTWVTAMVEVTMVMVVDTTEVLSY